MSRKQRKRIEPGAVLEVELPGEQYGYILYVGDHEFYGDAVIVSRELFAERPGCFDDVFSEGYVTFYPAALAARRGLVEVVSYAPVPAGMPPTRLRRPIGRVGRRVVSWMIKDGEREYPKKELSDEERELPVAVGLSHDLLVQRIASGWRPETYGMEDEPQLAPTPAPEVTSNDARDSESGRSPSPSSSSALAHYLYFPKKRAATAVAKQLERDGYSVSVELGANDASWLVLARHTVTPSDDQLIAVRDHLDQIAAEAGGEYDGWEAEVSPP